MPSLLGGILHGFNKVAAQGRADEAARQEKQADRESQLLLHIATTADDPDVADAAASALVETTMGAKRPKGGYWERLVGASPDTVNPVVSNVMNLIRGGGGGVAPATGSGAGGTAPRPAVVAPPPAPAPAAAPEPPPQATGRPGSLAQSPTALGQPGGTPPAPGKLAPPPSVPGPMGGKVQLPQMGNVQAPPQVNQPPDAAQAVAASANTIGPLLQPPPSVMDQLTARTTNLRHIWNTPSQRQREANQIHAEGLVLDMNAQFRAAEQLALSSGATPEQARQSALKKIGVGPEIGADKEGNVIPDKSSPTGYSQQIYRLENGQVKVLGQIPAPKPAAITNAETAASRVTNDRDAVALELFGHKYGLLDQPSMARVNATIERRAVNLAGQKARQSANVQTDVRNDRTTSATVMYPDGQFGHAKKTLQGDLVDEEGNVLPPNVIEVNTSAALPPKIDAQGKSVLTGLDVMRSTNARLKKAIEDAGLQNDNNPIPVKWDQWLYQQGVDPGDLAKGLPFSEYAQLGGTSEAYGLRGLIGGRPNQTLINIYGAHLAQPGNTPQLMYKKLTELDNIMNDVESAVLKAQGTKIKPDVKGGTGTPAGTTTLPANYDGTREQGGFLYHVVTDANGKVIKAELKGPAPKKGGGEEKK